MKPSTKLEVVSVSIKLATNAGTFGCCGCNHILQSLQKQRLESTAVKMIGVNWKEKDAQPSPTGDHFFGEVLEEQGHILTHLKQDEALEPLGQGEQEELELLKMSIKKRRKLTTRCKLLAKVNRKCDTDDNPILVMKKSRN